MREAEGKFFFGYGEASDLELPLFDPAVRELSEQDYNKRYNAEDVPVDTGNNLVEDSDEEMLLDDIMKFDGSTYRFDKVKQPIEPFCLPRHPGCVSEKFIYLMNEFGSQGGFELIFGALRESMVGEQLSLLSVCHLTLMVSQPLKLFHYDFVDKFGNEFVDMVLAHVEAAGTAQVKTLEP